MADFFADLRYALRSFLKNPVWVAAALLSITLGIGANTAIFSLTDQLLLRSLPVKSPDRLVLFSANGPRRGRVGTNYDDTVSFSYPMFCDFRDRAPSVSGVLARFPVRLSLSSGDHTDVVQGDLVSGTYFDVLGVHPALGRLLAPDDERLEQPNDVAVLSYAFWKSRFASSPSVLNQTVRLNGRPMTIVGVAQSGFKGVGVGEAPDVFVPMALQPAMTPTFDGLRDRRSYWLNIFARLKDGVPREQAETSLNVFWRPILEQEARETPDVTQKFFDRFIARHLQLLPGSRGISSVRETASGPLVILMCMVGVLLLIACANVANLLIARAAGRQREIAIRLAIGAGRTRLLRQLLAEGMLLSITGGILGVLAAIWTGDLLLGYLPTDASVSGLTSAPDVRVLGFGILLSLATGVFFGLAPAWGAFKVNVTGALKAQSGNVSGSTAHLRFRKGLIVAQVGLSLVLLIGAGLFASSLRNLKLVDPGFRARNLLSFTVQPSLNGYDQPRIRSLYDRLQDRLKALPSVRAVAMAEIPILSGSTDISTIEVPGYQPHEGENMGLRENFVGPGYFSAMGMPLLAGREFTAQDGPTAPKVAVINQHMARKYFGAENPVGRKFHWKRDDREIEIVGVVRDGKHADLREDDQPFGYMPYAQHDSLMGMTFYVRTTQDSTSLGTALRNELREVDPNLPLFNMKTIEQQIDEIVFTDRLVALLSTCFGILATVLAAIGLYGVMAYSVSRRTREIGLRMALGAARAQVLRMVMTEAGRLALAGILIAIPAAYGLSRFVQAQLFNVRGADPRIFIAATLALAAVVGLAGLIPGWRATRIDPMRALRNE